MPDGNASSTAAAITTPAAAPQTTQTPPAAAATGTELVNPGAWMAGMNDDLKGYTTSKGFKDPATLVDSYRNLEKLIGAPKERILKIAEKFYDDNGKLTPEARENFERFGAPKEAKEYRLETLLPKEGGDKALMDHFANVFHEAGVPKSTAERIVKSWNEYQSKGVDATKAKQTEAFNNDSTKLKTEWGAAFEQNRTIAAEAMRTLGLTNQEVDAMASSIGHFKTMNMLKNLGKSVGEGQYISGRPAPNQVLEPGSAKSQIKNLMGDPNFVAKYNSTDPIMSSEAQNQIARLNQMAYPD